MVPGCWQGQARTCRHAGLWPRRSICAPGPDRGENTGRTAAAPCEYKWAEHRERADGGRGRGSRDDGRGFGTYEREGSARRGRGREDGAQGRRRGVGGGGGGGGRPGRRRVGGGRGRGRRRRGGRGRGGARKGRSERSGSFKEGLTFRWRFTAPLPCPLTRCTHAAWHAAETPFIRATAACSVVDVSPCTPYCNASRSAAPVRHGEGRAACRARAPHLCSTSSHTTPHHTEHPARKMCSQPTSSTSPPSPPPPSSPSSPPPLEATQRCLVAGAPPRVDRARRRVGGCRGFSSVQRSHLAYCYLAWRSAAVRP